MDDECYGGGYQQLCGGGVIFFCEGSGFSQNLDTMSCTRICGEIWRIYYVNMCHIKERGIHKHVLYRDVFFLKDDN